MIDLKLASTLIPKLAAIIPKGRGKRREEIDKIADELIVIPEELAPFFVEPHIQPYNPADEDTDVDSLYRLPAFKVIEAFVNEKRVRGEGGRQMFILADAGMGKTSLLAMLKLSHAESFWPKDYLCEALKLGPDTLYRLKEIKARGRTVLLLDAMDEDSSSFGRVKERIVEILKATQNFLRVIITCRTQFFPKTDDPIFQRQDRVKIEGFTCPVKYLSLFDDDQVRIYLEKKFDNANLVEREEKIKKAEKMVNHMGDLRCRPMLLAYIDDLIEQESTDNPYQIYNDLVESWLDRETCKELDVTLKKKKLLNACIYLARYMNLKGVREVKENQLAKLIRKVPKLADLKLMNVGGRSLLNKNSDGDFRFAHQSFQEFLLVRSLKDWGWNLGPLSDVIKLFLRHLNGVDLSGASLIGADFGEANLNKAKLKEADLSEANLSEVNLIEADLGKANLNRANLNRANLSKANLIEASLTKTNMCEANLGRAKLCGSNLIGTDLSGADLSRANMSGANLTEASLRNANLYKANMINSTPIRADLREINLVEAHLCGASLIGADLSGADLSEANLSGVDLSNANLNKANLRAADLSEGDLSGANMNEIDLNGAYLRKADLSRTNLSEIKHWRRIEQIKWANIFETKNLPECSREWALERGAVEMSATDWKAFNRADFAEDWLREHGYVNGVKVRDMQEGEPLT